MKIPEDVGCFLGGCLVPLFEVGRFIVRGILWIVSFAVALLIIEPHNVGTGLLLLVVWAIVGFIVDNGFSLLVLTVGGLLASRQWGRPLKTLIYSQPNWPEELQQILAVEVPEINGRLPLPRHKDLLRDRYRRLAETAIADGLKPEETVEDLLEVSPPSDDPQEIADSILNSEAFHNLMLNRDESRETSVVDQKMLRRMYDGTDLEQIVRLLRENYLNSLDVGG